MLDLLKALSCRIHAVATREQGQALTEYALVLALIALAAIIVLLVIGNGVTGAFNAAGHAA